MELDVRNMFADRVGPEHGIQPAELEELSGRIAAFTADIQRRRGQDIGFMELAYNESVAAEIAGKAHGLREWCKNFVVLGIGGSALGNIALHSALNHPFHNILPADAPERMGAPRIFVLDNIDPVLIHGLLDAVRGEEAETVFNVITKSGQTAETMSQFLFVRELLEKTAGTDPVRQILVTTDADPQKSLLKRIARDEGYDSFHIPANVGGRFSVLSPVGLLSAAVGGIDIESLLGGARAMDGLCRGSRLQENPAALYAALLFLFCRRGKPITVLMPYSNALRRLADWYCQLWAESLGKRDGLSEPDRFVGPTPIGAVGVTDQHSVMQLYQDGPFDKVITFVEVETPAEQPLKICSGSGTEELSYLSDRTFDELFNAELRATNAALRDKSRPNCTLRIPQVSPSALGELFMFFEYAVTYGGYLHDVDPFNQPGVELGKRYTYGLMGRPGFEPPGGL